MTDSEHCPGFESNRNLEELICTCGKCGAKVEVFADELNSRTHKCEACGEVISSSDCAAPDTK